jgi:hypothetical protein
MKRLDDGKVSLVEFLSSIKFAHRKADGHGNQCPTHFAHLNERARGGSKTSAEDSQLIRSAN